MNKIEIRRMVTAAAAACEEKKANDINILELDPADSGFTDYFLICSGTNSRQNQAIADGVEDAMKRAFNSLANAVEGYRQGEWILLDYVDFVVHIFSEEKRDFYDIERLRKTATSRDLVEMKASLAERVRAVRTKKTAKKKSVVKPPAKKSAPRKAKTAIAAVPRHPSEKKAVKGKAKKRTP